MMERAHGCHPRLQGVRLLCGWLRICCSACGRAGRGTARAWLLLLRQRQRPAQRVCRRVTTQPNLLLGAWVLRQHCLAAAPHQASTAAWLTSHTSSSLSWRHCSVWPLEASQLPSRLPAPMTATFWPHLGKQRRWRACESGALLDRDMPD